MDSADFGKSSVASATAKGAGKQRRRDVSDA